MHRLCCCKLCSATAACCSSTGKSKTFDRSSFGTGCKCCQYPDPCCNNISSVEMQAAAGLGGTCMQFSTVNHCVRVYAARQVQFTGYKPCCQAASSHLLIKASQASETKDNSMLHCLSATCMGPLRSSAIVLLVKLLLVHSQRLGSPSCEVKARRALPSSETATCFHFHVPEIFSTTSPLCNRVKLFCVGVSGCLLSSSANAWYQMACCAYLTVLFM